MVNSTRSLTFKPFSQSISSVFSSSSPTPTLMTIGITQANVCHSCSYFISACIIISPETTSKPCAVILPSAKPIIFRSGFTFPPRSTVPNAVAPYAAAPFLTDSLSFSHISLSSGSKRLSVPRPILTVSPFDLTFTGMYPRSKDITEPPRKGISEGIGNSSLSISLTSSPS